MNKLVENFLEKNSNKILFEEYLKSPNHFNKQLLQTRFNEFYFQIKLISYFSKSLHFFAQDFDKKIRHRNEKNTLVLVDPNEHNILENIPDEETFNYEPSFVAERVEEYFEHKIIYDVISKLTLKQKRIIYLFYVKNKSDKEIAKLLNVSIQTINKQRIGILIKIKGMVKKWK